MPSIWETYTNLAQSRDDESKLRALGILLDRFRELPEREAASALDAVATPSSDRSLRLALTRRLIDAQAELDIPWILDRKLLFKLAEDPDPEIGALARSSEHYKNYQEFEQTAKSDFVSIPTVQTLSNAMVSIMAENARSAQYVHQQVLAAESATASLRELARSQASLMESLAAQAQIREAVNAQAQLLEVVNSIRMSIGPTWHLQGLGQSLRYLESFADNVASIKNVLNNIQPSLEVREAFSSLSAQAPRIIERVVDNAEHEEGIEEISQLVSALEELAHDLPAFQPQEAQLHQTVATFQNRQFVVAHSALVNMPEGLLRALYQETGLGGTSDNVSTMAGRLRGERFISKQAEHFVKAIERDRSDHALRGEQNEFPEHNCRLVMHCLLKILRDYVFYQSLRKALTKIIRTDATYNRSTMQELLSNEDRIERLHVERFFSESKLTMTITLFRRDVFRFSCSPPNWEPQRI